MGRRHDRAAIAKAKEYDDKPTVDEVYVHRVKGFDDPPDEYHVGGEGFIPDVVVVYGRGSHVKFIEIDSGSPGSPLTGHSKRQNEAFNRSAGASGNRSYEHFYTSTVLD
ncbi:MULTISPECIES: hypothetical protein [unclassified Haloferax]|jgi:hypothetical protein|uniref:hypothetical protein n=1 Tax=unclassified Haloferax TaxID=2625095 RepID=UPI002874E1D5|nr:MULTISPECIES: hypothetical protein [unclassified Haloferax]MDS0243171.1 hypothetical protein [Haloferax sp. S2CR25]MDS0446292.1 hypothetical protein [Haloferax sp. S2CR25-2]